VKWLASALLAIVVFGSGLVAAPASLASLPGPAHRAGATGVCKGALHRTCGADGETRNGTSPRSDAVIEPAGASNAVHEMHPGQASSTCPSGLARRSCRHVPVAAAARFARPHDPRHLHAFSLLI
jgi:hypothetical protein